MLGRGLVLSLRLRPGLGKDERRWQQGISVNPRFSINTIATSISILLLVCLSTLAMAENSTGASTNISTGMQPITQLTVYSEQGSDSGFGLVQSTQSIDLKPGENKINLQDFPTLIKPNSIRLRSMSDPTGTLVTEQEFRVDLFNQEKLLKKFIGKELSVDAVRGGKIETYTGKLLGYGDNLIIQDANGTVNSISNYSNIRFPQFPEV